MRVLRDGQSPFGTIASDPIATTRAYPVPDTGAYPFSAIGKIYAVDPATPGEIEIPGVEGTAALIGSNFVLTAAHVLWNETTQQYREHVLFVPGDVGIPQQGGPGSIGCIGLEYFLSPKYKLAPIPASSDYDYALVVIDRDMTSISGYLGIARIAMPMGFACNVAYPSVGVFKYDQMYAETALASFSQFSEQSQRISPCDFKEGSSGGPWLALQAPAAIYPPTPPSAHIVGLNSITSKTEDWVEGPLLDDDFISFITASETNALRVLFVNAITLKRTGDRRSGISVLHGTTLDGSKWSYPIADAVHQTQAETAIFLVKDLDGDHWVQAKVVHGTHGVYLRTSDDVTTTDNLDSLPELANP